MLCYLRKKQYLCTVFHPFTCNMDTIEQIKATIRPEWERFEQAFREVFLSENELVQQVGEHLLQKRGKQLRPLLVLLAARMCHGICDKTIDTAVTLELLHTASLVHDDVVDDAPTRRGQASVHARWNNKVAVLSGDYMLAKVIAITASLRNQKILSIVADMGARLSSGELMQLHAGHSMWISEKDYFRVIEYKTAALFAACMQAGAVSGGAPARQETALRNFGKELGIIFQLQDDLLDFSDSDIIGKPTMSDIRDGKATLPLIIALQRAPQEEAEAIRQLCATEAQSERDAHEFEQRLTSFILRYDGFGYTRQQMEAHKKTAMEHLSAFHDSSTKAALIQLLQYTISRVY